MRKILYPVLSLFFFGCSSSDDTITVTDPINNENDLRVTKVTLHMYDPFEQYPPVVSYSDYYYESGNLSQIKTTKVHYPKIYSEDYLYINNKLVELKSRSTTSDNVISNPSSIKYFYTGDLITSSIRESYGENYPSTYVYNSNGELLSKRENKPNGELNEKSEYQYYPDGNIYKITRADVYNSNPYVYTHELYDNKNNPYKLMFKNGLGKIIDESKNNLIKSGHNNYEYEYNQYDYPTKITETNSGKLLSIATFEYNK